MRGSQKAGTMALVLALPAMVGATSSDGCRGLPGAGTETDPVEVCSSTGWLEPSEDGRLGNAGGLAAAAGLSDPGLPTWGPEAPEASVTEGAGAAFVAHAAAGEAQDLAHGIAGARFEGTVPGNLDTIALDFYMVTSHEYDEYLPGSSSVAGDPLEGTDHAVHAGGTYPISLRVEVDDRHVDLGEVESYLYPPTTSGNVAAMRFRVAVTGLFDGLDDPAGRHDVAIQVFPHEDETTILFDAAEWPSKLVFNPESLTSYKVIDAAHADYDH